MKKWSTYIITSLTAGLFAYILITDFPDREDNFKEEFNPLICLFDILFIITICKWLSLKQKYNGTN